VLVADATGLPGGVAANAGEMGEAIQRRAPNKTRQKKKDRRERSREMFAIPVEFFTGGRERVFKVSTSEEVR
jgi:hypothetical protein